MRFSILSALFLTTIVALSVAIFIRQSEFSKLKTVAGQLKQEVGYFPIDDPNLVYLRELECNIPDAWRFRVFVPESTDAKIHLGIYFGGSGELSFATVAQSELNAGEYVLTIYLEAREHGVWFSSNGFNEFGGGSSGSLVTAHPIFKTIVSGSLPRRKRGDNFPHGELVIYDPELDLPVPIVFFPAGVKQSVPHPAHLPIGAAIWIAPPHMGQLDQRIVDAQGNE